MMENKYVIAKNYICSGFTYLFSSFENMLWGRTLFKIIDGYCDGQY